MTEQLLQQQLESPSGTGRVDPEVTASLTRPAINERDANRQIPFSLAAMRLLEVQTQRRCPCGRACPATSQ